MPQTTAYHATAYKVGVNGANPRWDITFTEADFGTIVGAAWIEGPFSLQVDVDATAMGYPLMIGIELQGISSSINISDRTHIAFISRERRVVTSASVPQLAYIVGTYNKIIIHCYGYTSVDAANCKVSLRIGPPAVISAPQEMIGRDTMANEPGVLFSVDSGTVLVAANSVNTSMFSILAGIASGLRFRVKAVSITLYPTPSYAGDLFARLEIVTRASTIEPMQYLTSKCDEFAFYNLNDGLTLDVGYTLRCFCDNRNPAIAYNAMAQVTYETVY